MNINLNSSLSIFCKLTRNHNQLRGPTGKANFPFKLNFDLNSLLCFYVIKTNSGGHVHQGLSKISPHNYAIQNPPPPLIIIRHTPPCHNV